MRALCLSIHDVAPDTWVACQRLIEAVQAVAPVPLTMLVVPHWHRLPCGDATNFYAALTAMQAQGHELALHGYVHLDEGPRPRSLAERFRRRVLTRSEGEFAALDTHAARCRLQAGIDWFAARGWNLSGFVAPAWMMNAASSAALQEIARTSGLRYATRFGGMVLLPQGHILPSPALVYSARSVCGDAVVRAAVRCAALRQQSAPLLRIALHPADVGRPATIAHAQSLIRQALQTREPLTKAAFVERWRGGGEQV